MMLKNSKFSKFFIVNMKKRRHIRKVQSISNPNKKNIVQKSYETEILRPKQDRLNFTNNPKINIFEIYAIFQNQHPKILLPDKT